MISTARWLNEANTRYSDAINNCNIKVDQLKEKKEKTDEMVSLYNTEVEDLKFHLRELEEAFGYFR